MAEKIAEVKVLDIYMICDKCGKGQMRHDFHKPHLCVLPPMYVHVCDNCEYEENYRTIYPRSIHIPIEELRDLTEEEREQFYYG